MPLPGMADRAELRRAWVEAWRKARAGQPLSPLEAMLAELLELHPEYQALMEDEEAALAGDWGPEGGRTNPFLHLGLHAALRECIAADRPAGIRELFGRLVQRRGDAHEAEHLLIDCLAATLWEAGRAGQPPDEAAFLRRARRLAGLA